MKKWVTADCECTPDVAEMMAAAERKPYRLPFTSYFYFPPAREAGFHGSPGLENPGARRIR